MNSKKFLILENSLDIQPLISTRDFLSEALDVAHNKFEIAGAIQAFEVCYELSWKTLKKILSLRGINVYTPKEVFRIAGLEGLIDNAENWFDYVDKRNITSHQYEQDILEIIYPVLPSFLQDLDLLINKLKKL